MPSSDPIRIALVQSAVFGGKRETIEKTVSELKRAAEQGAQVVCLQELFATPYFCQEKRKVFFELAEEIPGPTVTRIAECARNLQLVVIAPVFEKTTAGPFFNSAAIIDADGSLLGAYRKVHLPEEPQFHEKYYFDTGSRGFPSWQTRYGKIGVCICWDQWFPEAARLMALDGAQILFYPTAIGWIDEDRNTEDARDQQSAWEAVQRSHAVANGCFVAAANRVGVEKDSEGRTITFWGSSFVANPAGRVIAKAGETESEVLLAEVDFSEIERQRLLWPFLRERQVKMYGGLLREFEQTP